MKKFRYTVFHCQKIRSYNHFLLLGDSGGSEELQIVLWYNILERTVVCYEAEY